jgi:hypothetical protein
MSVYVHLVQEEEEEEIWLSACFISETMKEVWMKFGMKLSALKIVNYILVRIASIKTPTF